MAVAAKDPRLVFQEVHNLHRRALLVVVVNLGRVASLHHALVNTLNRVLNVEQVHIHVAEGSAVMRERTIADGRSGYRGKPAVEDGILRREPSEHRQPLRRKIRHDGVGSIDAGALRGVALDEPLHICDAAGPRRRAAEYLEVDAGKVVIGVMIQLALKFRIRLHGNHGAVHVGIGFIARQAIDFRIFLHQAAQHVVEGAVLHHEDDDVFEVI